MRSEETPEVASRFFSRLLEMPIVPPFRIVTEDSRGRLVIPCRCARRPDQDLLKPREILGQFIDEGVSLQVILDDDVQVQQREVMPGLWSVSEFRPAYSVSFGRLWSLHTWGDAMRSVKQSLEAEYVPAHSQEVRLIRFEPPIANHVARPILTAIEKWLTRRGFSQPTFCLGWTNVSSVPALITSIPQEQVPDGDPLQFDRDVAWFLPRRFPVLTLPRSLLNQEFVRQHLRATMSDL